MKKWLVDWIIIVVIFAVLAIEFVFGLCTDSVTAIWDFVCHTPERSDGGNIITPLLDDEVPVYLRPIVVVWRRMAGWLNYNGPVVWRFRGGVTLLEIAAEYGHRRILKPLFACLPADAIWPNQPMFVFWMPCMRRVSFDQSAKNQLAGLADLHREHVRMPQNHYLSFGHALVLYLLLLHHKCATGRYFLPSERPEDDGWLVRTDTILNGRRIHICVDGWFGLALDLRGDDVVDREKPRVFALGIEPANDSHLKQAA